MECESIIIEAENHNAMKFYAEEGDSYEDFSKGLLLSSSVLCEEVDSEDSSLMGSLSCVEFMDSLDISSLTEPSVSSEETESTVASDEIESSVDSEVMESSVSKRMEPTVSCTQMDMSVDEIDLLHDGVALESIENMDID